MNILITSAGRRVSLVRAFRRELHKYFPDTKVLTVDHNPELSPACHDSDGYFKVPKVNDPLYVRKIIEICNKNNIKIVVPTIDTELIMFAESVASFKYENIIPLISSIDVIRMCRDKRKTHEYFDSIGFPRAADIDPNNPHFPIFAKPFNGSSSMGVITIENKGQLNESLINNDRMMFLEYLSPELYTEFTIDMYFDKTHHLKCAVPRERIEIRTGEVSKSVTKKTEFYNRVCSKFTYCPGFIGCITLQIFKNKTSEELYGIEINPRFGGGYPLSYFAEANFPEMIIKEYLLNEDIPFFEDWIENLLMLRYDDEILVYDYKGNK